MVIQAAHQSRLRLGRVSLPGQAYHIIMATDRRRPLFSRLPTARAVIRVMKHMQDESWLHAHAWVLMPDHLHWLFTLGERADLSATINRFKSGSSHAVKQIQGDVPQVWQQGFFDHGVRQEEDLRTLARYIIANPLRAGLCANMGAYPWWDAEWI